MLKKKNKHLALKINANQRATSRYYSERAILSAVRDKVAKVVLQQEDRYNA